MNSRRQKKVLEKKQNKTPISKFYFITNKKLEIIILEEQNSAD